MTRQEFGKWIREAREKAGFNRQEASRRLGYKSNGTLNTLEQGINPISLDLIPRLSDLYHLDVEEILLVIEQVDPEVTRRYRALQEAIIKDFTSRILRGSHSREREERAAHHRDFSGLPAIYYRN